MKKAIILLRDFGHLSIPDLLTLARAVMAGSIYAGGSGIFLKPPVSSAEIEIQCQGLTTYYDAARSRNVVAVAQQNLAEKILFQSLNNLARYAASLVYGDKAAIEATGYNSSSDETHAPTTPAQVHANPEALKGGGISIILPTKGKNTACFSVIAIPADVAATVNLMDDSLKIICADMAAVTIRTDTHNKIIMQDLARRSTYNIYVYAIGSAGNSPLSEVVQVTTQ